MPLQRFIAKKFACIRVGDVIRNEFVHIEPLKDRSRLWAQVNAEGGKLFLVTDKRPNWVPMSSSSLRNEAQYLVGNELDRKGFYNQGEISPIGRIKYFRISDIVLQRVAVQNGADIIGIRSTYQVWQPPIARKGRS